ncbi:MAG: hypothetical protein ACO32I_05335 [Candidatus Limnocylindrus sp.]
MSRPLGYGGRGAQYSAVTGADNARAGNAPKYPHPFFDQGQAYLPTSVKNLFHWCRYYYLTNPAVNSAITKMAEYPVTDLTFKTDDDVLRQKYMRIVRNINLKAARVEIGLDYYTYGNAFVSVMFPFRKFLTCAECKHTHDIKAKSTKYKWVSQKYQLTCAKCGFVGFAKARDQYLKSVRDITILRWDPERIDLSHDAFTGKTTYYYEIPPEIQNEIRMGRKERIETTPEVFIRAVQLQRKVMLSADNLYHFKRPTLAQKSMGWGVPLVMPVLKDLHYLGVLRRSQEAIAQEHIVPLRIVFPQAGTATSDPYSMVNLGDWKQEITKQLSQWKLDPNRIPIMPVPLGVQTIGGDGRALILHQEYRVWMEHIIAGMGVPPEFVFGGIQFSGTNLTMFQLHNKFLGYIDDQRELVYDFILGKIAAFMGYPPIDGDFRPFKMADDMQRTMLYFQLVQAQKLSERTLLEDLGFDPEVESRKMDAERGRSLELQRRMLVQQAHIQGDIMDINTRYQGQSQLQQTRGQMENQKLQTKLQQEAEAETQQAQQTTLAAQANQSFSSNGALPDGAVTGDSVAPGFPDGATAYSRNGRTKPQTGLPPWQADMKRGPAAGNANMDITYVAKRAAAYIRSLPPDRQQPVLQRMSQANPQLYQIVSGMLEQRRGDQSDPLNPTTNPLPQQKPSRATPARKVGY